MNLSDPSDDDSSSDECPVPAKRPRADTYGASSTTSHGSILQESDDEPADESHADYRTNKQSHSANKSLNYIEQSPHNDIRLSRSSLSENCSSPSDHYDDYRTGFDEDADEGSVRASFHDNDNVAKNSESSNEPQNSKGGFSDKIKHMMSNMGYKAGEGSVRASFHDNDNVAKNSKSSNESQNSKGGFSDKIKHMMNTMGYKAGKGLGKNESGRTEPVEASTQKGRRGLGLKSSVVGSIPRDFKWSPDDAKPEAKEKVLWMPKGAEPLSGDQLEEWLRKGPKKLTIEDETEFVDPQILNGVLNAKTIFDTLDDEDLRNARFRSNPYETIGAVIFLNRAAVKMANIDALFDFGFTEPKTQNGKLAIDRELLYFADVCAGPGGFSEYVLHRKGWRAKGFGFTLKGGNDFKLSDFHAGTAETFNPYYGVENDGNIFNPANLMSLKDYVLKQTDDKGVHFLMADGGFSVEGQENIQEILSKQLYLCQCLAALMLVRTGGHFVVKLFDVFTSFSVGLIYIMYRCFDRVCIHKPVTSRPANSERYLICFWKRLGTESAEHHLYSVNSTLWEGRDRSDDVTELVPLSVLQEDTGFYEYMYQSNCLIGEKQIKNLLKIAEFSKNKDLKETTQAEIREECLNLWKLPDKLRTQTERLSPEDTLTSVLGLMRKRPKEAHSSHTFKSAVLNKPPNFLEDMSDLKTFKNVYDWHFYFLSNGKSSPDLKFFIGCGGKQVHQLEGSGWKSVVDLHLTLPAKTLLYGEIVKEYRGVGNNQMFSKALHVIDALMLGGIDISHLPLSERIHQCGLFCAALSKPCDNSSTLPIRCKRLFNMEDFASVINNLECRAMKRVRKALTLDIPDRITNTEIFHVVGSVLFVKEMKEPWQAHISKKCGRKYYFGGIGKDKKPLSLFHIIEDAGLDLVEAYTQRVMWNWEEAACAIFEGTASRGVTRAQMEGFIEHKTKR